MNTSKFAKAVIGALSIATAATAFACTPAFADTGDETTTTTTTTTTNVDPAEELVRLRAELQSAHEAQRLYLDLESAHRTDMVNAVRGEGSPVFMSNLHRNVALWKGNLSLIKGLREHNEVKIADLTVRVAALEVQLGVSS